MSTLSLLIPQLFARIPYPTQDFTGQTVIVTGSNTGLGLEAARHLTRLNAKKVILAVRSLEKGEAAKKSIETTTKRTGVVEVWQLDLSSFESVKKFSARVNTLDRLDAVLENASIAKVEFTLLENNEATITVNVISTFLLGLLVLPKLKESARRFNIHPRLTVVASGMHFLTKLDGKSAANIFETLSDPATANMSERYAVSKLMQVLLVKDLASRLTDNTVIVNAVCPGFCHSELTREVSGVAGLILGINKMIFARSTEVGSRNLVYAISAGIESHGSYISDCKISTPSTFVLSEDGKALGRRLWKELNSKLDLIAPGVTSNV